jgi:hypothetical protein
MSTAFKIFLALYLVVINLLPCFFYSQMQDVFLDKQVLIAAINFIFGVSGMLVFRAIVPVIPLSKKIIICLVLIIGWLLVSTWLNNRLSYEWPFFCYLISFFPIGLLFHQLNNLAKEYVLPVFFGAYLLCFVVQVVYSLVNIDPYWSNYLVGSLHNPGKLSYYLFCCSMPALYLLVKKQPGTKNRVSYNFSCIIVAVAVGISIYNISRSVLISWLLITLIALFFAKKFNVNRKWFFGAASAFFCAVFLLLFYVKKESSHGRLLVYKLTAWEIMQKPVAGHGKGAFPALYNNLQSQYFYDGRGSFQEAYYADDVFVPYNEFLMAAFEGGVVFLILPGYLLFLLLRKSNAHFPRMGIAGYGFVSGFLVHALFFYSLDVPELMTITIHDFILFHLLMHTNRQQPANMFKPFLSRVWLPFFMMVMLIGFMALVYLSAREWRLRNSYCSRQDQPLSCYWLRPFNKKIFLIVRASLEKEQYRCALKAVDDIGKKIVRSELYQLKGDIYRQLHLPDSFFFFYKKAHYVSPLKATYAYEIAEEYYNRKECDSMLTWCNIILSSPGKNDVPIDTEMTAAVKEMMADCSRQPF